MEGYMPEKRYFIFTRSMAQPFTSILQTSANMKHPIRRKYENT